MFGRQKFDMDCVFITNPHLIKALALAASLDAGYGYGASQRRFDAVRKLRQVPEWI